MILKHELQNIISGNGKVRYGEAIQAINHFLRRQKKSVSGTEKTKFVKAQETKVLIDYIGQNKLWFEHPDKSKYIGEGAEQKYMNTLTLNTLSKQTIVFFTNIGKTISITFYSIISSFLIWHTNY